MRAKLLESICLSLLLTGCCCTVEKPVVPLNECITMQSIEPNGQVVFLTTKQCWNTASLADERVVFTKYISSGSGSFSIYKTGDLLTQLPTTYEFICNGHLYGYNAWNWKFYEINYDSAVKKFYTVELKQHEIEQLFPNMKVVPLSQMKDNTLALGTDSLEPEFALVWNDTKEEFYRYSFEGDYQPEQPFNSVFYLQDIRTLKYSHFGTDNENYPAITIKIQ